MDDARPIRSLTDPLIETEKRRHRRLQIQLPLEFCAESHGRQPVWRTATRDISTGGVYFELTGEPFEKGTRLHLELTVPSGTHFPFEGRVKSTAQIVRIEPINSPDQNKKTLVNRFGIAVRLDRWELTF